MMQPIKPKKLNSYGFTLTEVSLAFLIGTIVIVVCSTILFSGSNYFRSMETTNRDKLFADNMLDTIKEELAYAENIQILASGSSQTPTYAKVLKIVNGRLYLNNTDMYETIYTNQTAEIQLTPQSGAVLSFKINIKGADGSLSYTTTQTFTANTMAALNRSFSGITTGTLTNPIISYQKSGT